MRAPGWAIPSGSAGPGRARHFPAEQGPALPRRAQAAAFGFSEKPGYCLTSPPTFQFV